MDYLSAMASVRAVARAALGAGHGARRVGMARVRDLYEVLGVPRDASDDDIKKAYRRARPRTPPRRERRPAAEERFKEVAGAYEILSDPEKRQQYDTFGQTGGPAGAPFGDIQDIFDMFFGGGFGGRRRRGRRPLAYAARRGPRVRSRCRSPRRRSACGTTSSSSAWSACDTCLGNGAATGHGARRVPDLRRDRARSSRCDAASSAP